MRIRDARAARRAPETTLVRGTPMIVLGRSRLRTARERPSPLLQALVEAIVPDATAAGDPARANDASRVARFVQGQVDALPLTLRLLMQTGFIGFRLAIGVRFGRDFLSLPPETRRRVVHAWAFGRFGLARQLFRVVRSTALLAYYDLPQDRATPLSTRIEVPA